MEQMKINTVAFKLGMLLGKLKILLGYSPPIEGFKNKSELHIFIGQLLKHVGGGKKYDKN